MQLTASTLRTHLGPALADGPLAMKVASFVKLKMLPYQIRNPGVTEVERREDLEDGIEYKASDQGKQNIEEKRIQLLGAGCAYASHAALCCTPLLAH